MHFYLEKVKRRRAKINLKLDNCKVAGAINDNIVGADAVLFKNNYTYGTLGENLFENQDPATKDASEQIIVVMDEINIGSGELSNVNATITSLYAGTDYRKKGAEKAVLS